jgi:hypothetical protein
MTKAAELAKMGEVLTNSQIGGRRNILINGAMQVAQRSTSETGLGASSGYFTLDRFRITSGNNAGRLTMSQSSVTDLPGFANALKMDCTTADTSTDAAENLRLQTLLEGQDLQQLKKGTSSAEKFTISFYVKGNASATYMLELFDGDNSRHNTQQFAVTSSWNRISLTFAGDTTGAFDDDNALSLYLNFWLHAGSNFTSGTYTANTWASNTNANRAVGISSFFDSTDRTLEITGLQMEIGSQATPFEHRSFGEELALCQRYYWKSLNYATAPADNISNSDGLHSDGFGSWTAFSSTGIRSAFIYNPVAMRGDPTVTLFSSARANTANTPAFYDGSWAAVSSPVLESGELRIGIEAAVSSVTANESFLFAGGYQCDSEL